MCGHGGIPSAAMPNQIVVAAAIVVESKVLIEHCSGHLAPFKIPRVIHIVDSIPKGPTGKIQRNLLSQALDGR